MLSALLQGYVEDVFVYASKRLFKTLKGDEVIARYTDTYFRWGILIMVIFAGFFKE